MKKVYSHENLTILTLAKNMLERNGIDCFIKNEYHASGGHVGWEAVPIELWVHDAEKAENAVSILDNELASDKNLPDWKCGNCGEDNDASFESCWKCQRDSSGIYG